MKKRNESSECHGISLEEPACVLSKDTFIPSLCIFPRPATFSFGSCLRWKWGLKEKAAPKEKTPLPARQEKIGCYVGINITIEGSVAGGWNRGGVGAYEPDPTK